jgi:hypothetical protein
MRGASLSPHVIEAIVSAPESRAVDSRGNPILTGTLKGDRPVEVVVALDDPEFVITVIPRRKRR